MSVDLSRNGQEIKAACSEVVSDDDDMMIMIMMMMMIPQVSEKNETDWAMFGYEGQSNVIKVVATGQKFVGRHQYKYYCNR